MAAAVSPRPSDAFDLRNQIPYAIRLGRDLSSCSSVQYNHKPDFPHPDSIESLLVQSSEGDRATLTLRDGKEEYKYLGRRRQDDDEYVLILDQAGKEFVLEKVESAYSLNLTRAPWESDSRTLAERYPQLHPDEHEEDLFGNADDDEDDGGVALDPADADASNPFDFRHYLDVEDSPSPKAAPAPSPAVSHASSTRTGTPLSKPVRKQLSIFAPQPAKPPPKPKTKQNPAHAKPSAKPTSRSPSPEPQRQRKTDAEVPAVRIDRRASNRIALPPKPPPKKREPEELALDGDDNGDLILEGDEPQRSSYHSKSSLGIALAGGLGEGPRSLRSAASSPAGSHINSPAPQRPSPLGEHQSANYDDDNDDELVMDPDEEANEYDEAESDVDDDDDVDALKLPSPAQTHRPSISGATVVGDDDFDLEKQMLLELEGGLEDYGGGGADSDEESEEE